MNSLSHYPLLALAEKSEDRHWGTETDSLDKNIAWTHYMPYDKS